MIINSEGYRIITGEDAKNRRQVIRRFTDILLQSGFEEVMITGLPPNDSGEFIVGHIEPIIDLYKGKKDVKLFCGHETWVESVCTGRFLQICILNPSDKSLLDELRNMALFLSGMIDDGFYLDDKGHVVNDKIEIKDVADYWQNSVAYPWVSENGSLAMVLNIDRICELIK